MKNPIASSISCIFLPAIIVFFTVHGFAQVPPNYANHWHFGNKAALDFTSGSPVAEGGSAIRAFEGCASPSSKKGNLQFYTNGKTLWDVNGNPMPNGSNLNGDTSSTQCLAVRDYLLKDIFYVFTLGSHLTGGTGGVWYSVVDMSLNGGLGDVVTGMKNIELLGKSCEGIAVARRSDGKAAWIIVHQLENNSFNAYLLDHSGFNPTPVVSSIGPSRDATLIIGQLRASHAGHKLAMTNSFNSPHISFFDFNADNGTVSNHIDLGSYFPSTIGIYGLEFSADDALLYVSNVFVTNYLSQMKLSDKTVTVLASAPGNYVFGALQMGPDYKIYMARNNEPAIDVINFPELEGVACGYSPLSVALPQGSTALFGLPNYPIPPHYILIRQQAESPFAKDASSQLEVFPNPASNCITISHEYETGSCMDLLQVIDQLGNVVMEQHHNGDDNSLILDVEGLSSGMYLLRIFSGEDVKATSFLVAR